MAFGASRAGVRQIVRGIDAEFAEAGGGVVLGVLVVGRFEHPRKNATMAATSGAPTARGVKGEIFRIELWKALAGFDVGAGGGEPREDLALGGEQETRALADVEGGGELRVQIGEWGGGCCELSARLQRLGFALGWWRWVLGLQVGDDDLDVVFFVTIEFLKGVDAGESAVGAHEFVALISDPGGDGLVVTLATADEWSAEVEVFRAARSRCGEHAGEEGAELAGRERGDGLVGLGVMLGTEPRVEEPEVLGDFGDRRDGGFAGAAGDTLFDRDGGRNSGEAVDGGARELFDELARVG